MKTKSKLINSMLALIVIISAIVWNSKKAFTETKSHSQISVHDVLKQMSLEEKIGQMLMLDFRYWKKQDEMNPTNFTAMNEEVGNIIQKYHLGGVILFKENMPDIEQTTRLIDGLQQASSKIPLLVNTDQEGGIVTRIQAGTNLPGNMAVGATHDSKEAYNTGKIIGAELKALGINSTASPVLDTNSNPENPIIGLRSFGSKPELVAQMGESMLRGLQDQNIIASAKHFPGHGDAGQDSHTELPLILHSREHLNQIDLVPFKHAIKNTVDMIMTAHLQVPSLDNTKYISKKDGKEIIVPATLSRKIMTDLLRNEMKFDGIIISDALEMQAISDHFGKEEAVIMAINSGVDIALMPAKVHSLEAEKNLLDIFNAVVKAVKDRKITEEKINDSVERILNLKIKRGLFLPKQDPLEEKIRNAKKIINNSTHKNIEKNMAEKAITLLKNEDNTLPLKPKKGDKLLVLSTYQSQVDAMKETMEIMKTDGKLTNITIFGIPFYKRELDDSIKRAIDTADYIVVGSDYSNKKDSMSTVEFTKDVIKYSHDYNKRPIIISLRNPYDVSYYSEAHSVLAIYGPNGYRDKRFALPNISAGIRVIFGENQPQGKLPVDIPSTTNLNQIAYPFGYSLSMNMIGTPKVNPVTEQDTKVTGTGEAGLKVSVVVDEKEIGNGKVDEKGNFIVDIPKQSSGKEMFISISDSSGNQSQPAIIQVRMDAVSQDKLVKDAIQAINQLFTDSIQARYSHDYTTLRAGAIQVHVTQQHITEAEGKVRQISDENKEKAALQKEIERVQKLLKERESQQDGNLVRNGLFDLKLDNWKPWIGSGAAAPEVQSDGRKSANVVKVHPNSSVEQVITGLKLNTTYELTLYAKSEDNEKFSIGVKNTGTENVSVPIFSKDYNQAKILFKTGSNMTTATVYLYKSGGAKSGYAGFIVAKKLIEK
ncbi:glycoside hydrolase family 3 N-terminal domain-containing protein [Bacillus cereus]|uniref:glycoside hydrolase family 3 N-terminal domain-containing protein n=1 Tax=Bacillus cereus TaxID=1396 RepID=UPI000279D194|nr:glycoside hydrolase family 3 N-terminal domain-containing protein [Bacillus cereus]EJR91205.1 hypothetical protein IKG_05735 [Bacillus cereus VD200]